MEVAPSRAAIRLIVTEVLVTEVILMISPPVTGRIFNSGL
jgi:hypothetical protein